MDAERWSSVKVHRSAIYSAYGFSGSGKTRTLIHNPDDRQTRDKPVLELVTNALKTLTDCSIDMYINDLYGEINDGGQKGVLAHLIKKSMKMTCYSYEDLIQGISNMTKHVPVDRTIMNKHLIQINLRWRQE
jgi:metal-sulfur cluster biosynthetic enzyme